MLFGPNTHLAAQAHLSYYLSNTMEPMEYYGILCNLSFQRGISPSQLKHALVTPRLKKPALDPDTAPAVTGPSPIYHLQTRRTSCRQALHEPCQPTHSASAYRPFHCTETAVLSVHNDLIRAVDDCRVSQLVLLDLSAAFDMVDHQVQPVRAD